MDLQLSGYPQTDWMGIDTSSSAFEPQANADIVGAPSGCKGRDMKWGRNQNRTNRSVRKRTSSLGLKLTIIITIDRELVWPLKHQKMLKNVDQCFWKSKMLMCRPRPADIQYTVTEDEQNQNMFSFKRLESQNYNDNNNFATWLISYQK